MRVLLIIIILLIFISTYVYKTSYREIPKLIWTYWHDNNPPETVKRCINTWREHNPDYEIVILNNTNLKTIYNIDISSLNIAKDFHARHADFARILIMERYGGIWIDSSTICTRNFKWIHDIQRRTNSDMIGFYSPHTKDIKHPIVENWFFASPPNSQFMRDWIKESLYMLTFKSESEYVDHVKLDVQDLKNMLPYLVMHLCALVIVHRKEYKIYLMNSVKGPFKYLAKNNWKIPESFNDLCKDKSLQTSIVKLRGSERNYIEKHRDKIKCDKETAHRSIYKVLI